MAQVIWTPQARRDLEAIVDYYLEVAPAFADVVEAGILAAVRRLEAFPQSGRQVPETDDAAIREVIWREYRILYYTDDDGSRVDVLSVLHTAQPLGEGRQA